MPKGAALNISEPLPFEAVILAVLFFAVLLAAGIVFVKNHPKAKEGRDK